MSNGKDKKKLKKERQHQKREHEALSRESSAITDISMEILIDTLSNPGEIGEDNLLCIHANESNFDWFNEYGDGGRWLTRSYDNIKYVTSCNAG